MSQLKVFLDLEDTIITNWQEGLLTNVKLVKSWLQLNSVKEVRIFSFAIWHEGDKAHFEKEHKPVIERALEVPVLEWLSVDEMVALSTSFTGIRWFDRTDFLQLRGKHGAFLDVCKAREKDIHCVLIDDAVPDETVIVHDRNLVIDLVRIVPPAPLRLLTFS